MIIIACTVDEPIKTETDTAKQTAPILTDIIDITSWQQGNQTTDPLVMHQPEEIDCRSSAFRMEGSQLEVQTDLCNYAFVEFAALQNVSAGQQAELLILHSGLWAAEDSEAHVAWLIKDQIFWEQTLPIPSSADFFYYEGVFPIDIQQGESISLHIHNHGANDWKLGYFNLLIDGE